jgi:nicotinate-nucleotide pyrophosphorylase (carboxylating)
MIINETYLNNFINLAIQEDIGDGDHTSLATIDHDQIGKSQLLVKQNGIIAGSEIARIIFQKLDPNIIFTLGIADGTEVKYGDIVFNITGNVIAILQAERIVLNIMQRLSGIATQTNNYVNRLNGLKTKVLDTRKTTPGMRLLDKYAVKIGGGENHRIGLYDMILIKDNHIDFAGSIEKALEKTKQYLKSKNKDLAIEIEARSIDDVKRILAFGGINRILLDNFDIPKTKEAVLLIANKAETESSGNITIDNIRDYAECGVDYISVGALTHQIKSLDLSLKAC